jgi:hypothetical protein
LNELIDLIGKYQVKQVSFNVLLSSLKPINSIHYLQAGAKPTETSLLPKEETIKLISSLSARFIKPIKPIQTP